jgi:DNA primase
LQRLDIVEVVNARVPLKKAGKDYMACCPFHQEKTPSFTVSQDKQFFHCFGCGEHGSAIGFVMNYEGLSFPEAVEELAREAGMEVPRELDQLKPADDLKPLFDLMTRAADFYRQQLKAEAAAPVRDYLRQRGLDKQIIADYGIGYAPEGWDPLIQAVRQRGVDIELLIQAGLATRNDAGRVYDRFRQRVLFPIRDPRGRVVAFGGRILPGTADESAPKYLNSPETPLFHKGRQLYGLYEMRQAIRRADRLLVVEGYMDVVALAQAGIRYGVATLGTATTAEHLELLFRQTSEIVFCFDGDRAGRDAAWKALKVLLPLLTQGREVRFLFLPEGEDPDTLVRKEGASAFEVRLASAMPLSDYLFQQLATSLDLASDDGRARYGEALKPYIEQIPQGLFKQMLWRRLARQTGLDVAQYDPQQAKGGQRGKRFRAPTAKTDRVTPVQMAVALVLKQPALALSEGLPSGWAGVETKGIDLLRALMEAVHYQPGVAGGQLLEQWREDPYFPFLNKLMARQLDIPEEGYAAEFLGCLQRLEREAWQQEFTRLSQSLERDSLNDAQYERLKWLNQQLAKAV